jgi:hypothetical protein
MSVVWLGAGIAKANLMAASITHWRDNHRHLSKDVLTLEAAAQQKGVVTRVTTPIWSGREDLNLRLLQPH